MDLSTYSTLQDTIDTDLKDMNDRLSLAKANLDLCYLNYESLLALKKNLEDTKKSLSSLIQSPSPDILEVKATLDNHPSIIPPKP